MKWLTQNYCHILQNADFLLFQEASNFIFHDFLFLMGWLK